MAFHPYLNFPGTCREAMTRYQEIFGGELKVFDAPDAPGEAQLTPDWTPDLVVHAALVLDDGMLMASDAPGTTAAAGTYVNVDAKDVDDAQRIFAALSEGGEVEMPMGETFWSPAFGACADRWGTLWMVSPPGPH